MDVLLGWIDWELRLRRQWRRREVVTSGSLQGHCTIEPSWHRSQQAAGSCSASHARCMPNRLTRNTRDMTGTPVLPLPSQCCLLHHCVGVMMLACHCLRFAFVWIAFKSVSLFFFLKGLGSQKLSGCRAQCGEDQWLWDVPSAGWWWCVLCRRWPQTDPRQMDSSRSPELRYSMTQLPLPCSHSQTHTCCFCSPTPHFNN